MNTFNSNSTFGSTPHKIIYVKLHINKSKHIMLPPLKSLIYLELKGSA